MAPAIPGPEMFENRAGGTKNTSYEANRPGFRKGPVSGLHSLPVSRIENGAISAQELLEKYCVFLYEKFGTYEEVSRRTRLDRRTVKKYILCGQKVRQDGFESITEGPG